MFKVYVLYSPTHKKIYVGYTSNLDERLRSHNELGHKGWTKSFRPWILVHFESVATKQEALKKEKIMKGSRGREWIWNLIRSKGLLSV